MNQHDRQILKLALPSIAANITVPLLSLCDTAIAGHLDNKQYIGAIATGSMIFTVIYWIFGFLRMGTSGITAQAYGNRNLEEVMRIFVRSLVVALAIGVGLIILQWPIKTFCFWIFECPDNIEHLANQYFKICIWGAPAYMAYFALQGWFLGVQNTKTIMFVSIIQNIINITASLTLVFIFNFKVEGVALGTLGAQYAGLIISAFVWKKYYFRLWKYMNWQGLFKGGAVKKFFSVNVHIFFRTVCVVSVMMYFTAAGAHQNSLVLAVNTLLMQFFTIFSFFFDGFAFAGEAMCGKFYGAKNNDALKDTISRLFKWGGITAAIFTISYLVGGKQFLCLLTNQQEVLEHATQYFLWVLAIPIASIAAFVWDGVFIGCSFSRPMLQSTFWAAITFFSVYFLLFNKLGNNALWLAFILYLFVRGLVLQIIWKLYNSQNLIHNS